jgi:hypothetical protein
MDIDHLDAIFEGMRCNVYFFESWTTYTHPVTPIRPMYFGRAVLGENYYRAWMCDVGAEPKFILFQNINNGMASLPANFATPSSAAISFFEADRTNGEVKAGKMLTPSETIGLSEFVACQGAGGRQAWVISQKIIFSYRYRYRADGRLASAEITNPEGKVNLLEY